MYFSVTDFFSSYGKLTVITALSVAAATVFTDKIIFGKIVKKAMPDPLKNYLPLAVSILAVFIADMIAKRAFAFTAEAFYSGLITGTLSTAIVAAVNKIFRGEKITLSVASLFIEGMLEGVVDEKDMRAVVSVITAILEDAVSDSEKESEIDAVLTEKSVKNLSEAERAALIRVITEGVKAIYRTENAEKTK